MSTVLILGATSDIGLAIARKFGGSGYDIQLAARDISAISHTASDISVRFGVRCTTHAFDADKRSEHVSFYKSLNPAPAVAIYAIGYMNEGKETFENPSEVEKTISSNYTGAVSILNIIAQDYATKKEGAILGISSVAGERGRQSNFIYGSAKAGFTAYLAGLRNYLYPFGVHVVTVKPGFVYTKMTEHLKLPTSMTTTPEKVAAAVYLAFKNNKNIIYVKGLWRPVMLIIRSIPESIFKKLKL
jgi:decaprenylphospho-beta-D-erythro-pentofuranosid-2-ulose 2-reductase